MGQITHPTLGSPMAMVTPYGELVVIGSRNVDISTNANFGIEYEHHEIHSGNHFYTRDWTTIVTSGGSLCFILSTPNTTKWTHLQFAVYSNNLVESEAFENITFSGGQQLPVFNNNRNSTNTYGGDIFYNGSITSSGTVISRLFFGEAGTNPTKTGAVGERGTPNEIVLKSGTSYMWCFKAGGNDTKLGWIANWYEHSDKIQQW